MALTAFQTNPRGVEAQNPHNMDKTEMLVSDEPSWG